MNQDINNVSTRHIHTNNESVDLIDIFLQLSKEKLTVFSFVAVTIILAVIYIFVAKEKWTSEAIITLPDAGQIANYNNAMGILYSQNPSTTPTVVDLQQRYFGRFNSALSALSEQLDNKEHPEKLIITQAVKDQPVPLKVNYTGRSAIEAQKILTSYIQQLNKRVVKELDDDLKVSIDSKITSLKEELATKEKVAQEKKDKRLEILNQALIVAQQSNIKSTLVQQAETLSEDTLFVLGSDALSSIIKNESTRPLPLDDSYFNSRQLLLSISALKYNSDTTYAFRYVMKPTLSIKPDSPKIVLIIILGALIGLMIGIGFVLTRNAIKQYKAN